MIRLPDVQLTAEETPEGWVVYAQTSLIGTRGEDTFRDRAMGRALILLGEALLEPDEEPAAIAEC